MKVIVPEYLNNRTLPYVSDVFYFDEINYIKPTGFIPKEYKLVFEFPFYCKEKNIELPQFVWEMCDKYFINDKIFLENLKIIEPLRGNMVNVNAIAFDRGIDAINKAKILLSENLDLQCYIDNLSIDFNYISREMMSHVLYEIFLIEGYEGSINYMRKNFLDSYSLHKTISAVVLNRFLNIEKMNSKILTYDVNLAFFLRKLEENKATACISTKFDSDIDDYISHRLFNEIICPIFGKCDTEKKSEKVLKIKRKNKQEIILLREICSDISDEIALVNVKNQNMLQKKLEKELKDKIIIPLTYMLEKPKNDIKNLLTEIIIDSSLFSLVLGGFTELDVKAFPKSIVAGVLKNSFKYLINELNKKSDNPSDLLLRGIKEFCIKNEDVKDKIGDISIDSLII